MIEAQVRSTIVNETKTWLDTPFHHRASIKGVGADCGAGLLYGVFVKETGLAKDVEIPEYSPQWWANTNEELLINAILAAGFIEVQEHLPGDIVVSKVGRVFSHSGIVVEWPKVIHANPDARKVMYSSAELYRLFAGRQLKFFSLFHAQS